MVHIEAIMIVKDEADTVELVLRSALHWASRVSVLDNGSVDGTWEVLQRLDKESPRINIVGRTSERFKDELRAQVFQEVRRSAVGVDWWARLDADEFYIVDPRPMLASVPRWHDAVLGSMFQFYVTELDLAAFDQDPLQWVRMPVAERLRWYSNNWAELRFVRAATTGHWTDTPWPAGTLRVARLAVPIRHYQYRNPDQIARRIASRSRLEEFVHERARAEKFESWAQVVVPHNELDYDDGVGPLVARHDTSTSLPLRIRRQLGWVARGASGLAPAGLLRSLGR